MRKYYVHSPNFFYKTYIEFIKLYQTLHFCLTLGALANVSCFLSSADFFFKINFQEYHLSVKQVGSRSRRFVGPDLGPNRLRKLSADDIRLVGFVALRPKSTAMVIVGWSVHLPWAGLNKRLTSNLCTYFRL